MLRCYFLARLAPAGPTSPYRNGSQDTGRGAKVSVTVGREDRASARSELRNARNVGGSWNVSGRETFEGGARAGAGCGRFSNRKRQWGFFGALTTGGKARQRAIRSGRRQGCRKAHAKTASEHLAPFRIPSRKNETGPACMQGVPSASEMHTASVAPVPPALA